MANLRRTGAALRRRPDAPAPGTVAVSGTPVCVETAYGAPRTPLTVTVRRQPALVRRVRALVGRGRRAGLGAGGPVRSPSGCGSSRAAPTASRAAPGSSAGGEPWQRDPRHGRHAAHSFHPILVEPIPDEVLARLRTFAHGFRGQWRCAWTRHSTHDTCRTFQDGLLRAASLTGTLQDLPSRDSACPFLYPPRTALWRAQDLLEAARARLSCWPARRAVGDPATGRSARVLSVYERVAGRYDRYWRRLWLLVAGRAAENEMLDAVTRAASLTGRPVVLDAGAGTGALSRRLAQALPDVHPVLVDLSPGMLARAGDLHDPRAVASIAALPFASSTFDVVMSAWVIETVDSPSVAVTEMLRVLRPGGLVAYSFCSRPVRRRDRWRTGPTRAVVHALFAGHFLRQEQTPFHLCDTSRRSSFAAGAATVVLLGKCCTVAAAADSGAPPAPPDKALTALPEI